MSFFADIKGSITGGRYFRDILLRPARQGLWFFARLLIITAFVSAFIFWRSFHDTFSETVAFFSGHFPEINFENGLIVNLPPQRLDHRFSGWRLVIDPTFIDESSIAAATVNDTTRITTIFVGHAAAFARYDSQIRRFQYPPRFSSVVKASDLQKKRNLISLEAFGFFILLFFITNAITSGFLILLIAAMIAYKFRMVRVSYSSAIKVGLYLISHQLLISMLLVIADLNIPFLLLWFILYYLVYVNLFLKPELESGAEIAGIDHDTRER